MAAKVDEEVVKAPGTLVVSVYVGYLAMALTVTPDIKHAGRSSLVFVDLSAGHARLGGSALEQVFKPLSDGRDHRRECDGDRPGGGRCEDAGGIRGGAGTLIHWRRRRRRTA